MQPSHISKWIGVNPAVFVAMDIVGYSRFRDDGRRLITMRRQFMRAVTATSLHKRTFGTNLSADSSGLAQYLGDELRIAFFRADPSDVEEFVADVFYKLKNENANFTLRAALTRGFVESANLFDCTYLIGEPITAASRMLNIENSAGCLLSVENFQRCDGNQLRWDDKDIWQHHFYTPAETIILPDLDVRAMDGSIYLVAAVGVKSHNPRAQKNAVSQIEQLIEAAAGGMKFKVNVASDGELNALVSVGPTAVLIAVRSPSASQAAQFISELKNWCPKNFETAIAISSGQLSVEYIDWIGQIFEGRVAIEATRIFTRLDAGELGFSADQLGDYLATIPNRFDLNEEEMISGKKDEQYAIRRNRFMIKRDEPGGANTNATNPTIGYQPDSPEPKAELQRFDDTLEALAYFGRLNEHLIGREQLDAAIDDQKLSKHEKWKLGIIKTNLVLPYYLLTEQIRRTANGLHSGELLGIPMNTLDRVEAAISAIENATESIVAVSIANDDHFWVDRKYLAANIAAADRLPARAFRRLLVAKSSQKSGSEVLKEAVEKQMKAKIELRILSAEELRRVADQVSCSWRKFHNLLIVDHQIATRSDADSRTEDGEVFWDQQEIQRELGQFSLLWNHLVANRIGDPGAFLQLPS